MHGPVGLVKRNIHQTMTNPAKEHNALLATRELMKIILDEQRYPDIPEQIRLSVKVLLRDYPERSVIDELYAGKTFSDTTVTDENDITEEEIENNNRIYNDNQTWETPGYKWKTQVEFKSAKS